MGGVSGSIAQVQERAALLFDLRWQNTRWDRDPQEELMDRLYDPRVGREHYAEELRFDAEPLCL